MHHIYFLLMSVIGENDQEEVDRQRLAVALIIREDEMYENYIEIFDIDGLYQTSFSFIWPKSKISFNFLADLRLGCFPKNSHTIKSVTY